MKRVYYNGKVLTMNEAKPYAEGFVLCDNEFDFVGMNPDLLSIPCSNRIDLQGKVVLPGLHDSHCHLLRTGIDLSTLDLSSCQSIPEIQQLIRNHIKSNSIESGGWVIAKGWDEKKLDENRYPAMTDLDEIFQEHAIYIKRRCGHVGVINSVACEKLDLENLIHTVEKSNFIFNSDGEFLGQFIEEAVNTIDGFLPKLSKDDVVAYLKTAMNHAIKLGLTSVHTEDFKYLNDARMLIDSYKTLAKEGTPLRVHCKMFFDDPIELTKFLEKNYYELQNVGGLFTCGTLKLQLDGILGTSTAYVSKPYEGSNDQGMVFYSQEILDQLVSIAASKGLEVACHCIGDAALNMYLEAITKARAKHENSNSKFRVVHASITKTEDLERMADVGVSCDVQMISLLGDCETVSKKIDPETAKTSYAWRSFLKKGLVLSGSSDSPSEDMSPFKAMYEGITRKKNSFTSDEICNADECIRLEDCLRLYTNADHFLNSTLRKSGRIEEGMLADFIVLNTEKLNAQNLLDVTVVGSVVNGTPILWY